MVVLPSCEITSTSKRNNWVPVAGHFFMVSCLGVINTGCQLHSTLLCTEVNTDPGVAHGVGRVVNPSVTLSSIRESDE